MRLNRCCTRFEIDDDFPIFFSSVEISVSILEKNIPIDVELIRLFYDYLAKESSF